MGFTFEMREGTHILDEGHDLYCHSHTAVTATASNTRVISVSLKNTTLVCNEIPCILFLLFSACLFTGIILTLKMEAVL